MEKKTLKQNTGLLYIAMGTYDGTLYNIYINPKQKEIKEKFSIKVSQNVLRTIYIKYPYNFISGTDEIIHMYDMKNKTSNGDLLTYTGSVNDIKIHKDWLIVAGDEPTISIWRMKDFQNITNMKGHKSGVLNIDIHHKGGFLVSAGKDKNIILFDMITGRKITKFELNYICNKILLFHNSKYLVCICDLHIIIYDLMKNTEDLKESIILDFSTKIIDAFIIKNKIIIFLDNADVKVFDIEFKEDDININKDIYTNIKLEVPEKENENDLDIKPRFISIAKQDKIRMMTIVFTNNDIYVYDFNKILKPIKDDNNNNNKLKKYLKLSILVKDKITCINSVFIE